MCTCVVIPVVGRRGGRWLRRLVAVTCIVLALAVQAVGAALAAVDRPAGGAAEGGRAAPQRVTWGVVPSGPDGPTGRTSFDLELDPGAEVVEYVGVVNFTLEELTLEVYAQDAFTTDAGGFDLLASSATSTGAGSWIGLASRQIVVPPRSRLDIPLRITVPHDASPGDHAAGIVASRTSHTVDPDGNRVAVENRVGARVYLRVSGELAPSVSIDELDVRYRHRASPVATGTARFTYRVRNTGNVRVVARPTVAAGGPFAWRARSIDGAALPELLPGESFSVTTELPGVVPAFWLRGELSVVATSPELRGGASAPLLARANGSATFWAVPWSALAIVVIVALVVAVVVWRRRRPTAAADEDPPYPGPPTTTTPTPPPLLDAQRR